MLARYGIAIACAALIIPSLQSASAQTFFTARLTPEQAGVESDGTPVGTAALALTEEGLRYVVTVDGLSGEVAAAHFHRGATGVGGGVIRTIDFTGTQASGIWTADDDQALTDELRAALLQGELYVNVHTPTNPAGEIRGQVLPTSGTSLQAALTADQETDDVESDGAGTAYVQLTDAGAIYHVTVEGLTGDIAAAHFHYGATGVSGGVVRGITFEGNTSFGVWTPGDGQPLVDSLVVALLLGKLYLNVHTAAYPAGEIRGQVLPNGGFAFEAILNAANEVGAVTSEGTGTGTFLLTDAGLIYAVTVSGLTGDISGAHFHEAAVGTDGPVVRGISFDGNSAAGVWRASDGQGLTAEFIRALFAEGLYVNVHTAQHPAGEIRGQVVPVDGTHLSARLTAEQSGTESDGTGTATMTLSDEGLTYRVTVDGLTGDISAAHFHTGAAGISGGVVHGITFEGNTASGQWTAADSEPLAGDMLVALLTGGLYLNVHTPDNPAGEIRGQVVVSGGAGLGAGLTSAQESAEVTQDATGTAAMTLTDAGLIFRATVSGLSGEISGAHFHDAPAGDDSGVVRGVTFESGTTTGVWMPSDAQALTDPLIVELLTGGIYLNVHTAANPAGEIRGQVELTGGVGRAIEMDAESAAVIAPTEGHGAASVSLTGAGLAFHATVSDLTGDIAAAHFHQAPLGAGGGVVRGVSFDGNNLRGAWRAADDQALNAAMLQAFFADELYLNVHTSMNPAGEIRGQVDNLFGGTPISIEATGDVPAAFALAQNYPNPFNPSTTITFDLEVPGHVRLAVFDAVGRQVALLHEGSLGAGVYQITFDARDLPSGVYFYRLRAGDRQKVRSMLLLR